MSVGAVCSREVIVSEGDSNIVDAARLMRSNHVGSIVVCERDGGRMRPVGIVTDRDLVVEILALGVDPGSVSLEDVMTPHPVALQEYDDLYDAVELMNNKGVRRAPVVDADGCLVGILAVDDILWTISRELARIVALSDRQQKSEARHRPGGV